MKLEIKKDLIAWQQVLCDMIGERDLREMESLEAEEFNTQDLHIDQVSGFRNIVGARWIVPAIFVFKCLHTEVPAMPYLYPRLHFCLRYAQEAYQVPKKLSRGWLKQNMSDTTPPSFMYTSRSFFRTYPLHYQIARLTIGENFKRLLINPDNYVFLSLQPHPPTDTQAQAERAKEYGYRGYIEMFTAVDFNFLAAGCTWANELAQ